MDFNHSKNWRIGGGATEIRGGGVRVSYNSVQLPRKAVCVYSENNTTLLEASFNNLISSLIRTYP